MHDEIDPSGLSHSFSVLVVEDELLIAMDLQLMLEENGYSVIGPATSVDAALRLLEGGRPDVAVLDVNLRGQTVVPVAERLRKLQIPFVVSSAYSSFDFEGSNILDVVENVGKPIYERHLLEALGRAINSA